MFLSAYCGDETTICSMIIGGFKSVIDVIEDLIDWSKEIDSRLQFHLRLVSLSFCGNKSNIFSFWSYIVSIRAAEKIPVITVEITNQLACVELRIWKQLRSWKQTYMSDLRPSCFCGRMTCAEWESLVSGIGWLIMHIARATFPTFWTYWID